MTNFKLEQNVTSLEDSKRLAEAGYNLEADDVWFTDKHEIYEPVPMLWSQAHSSERFGNSDTRVKAYRLDRLLAELPDTPYNLVNKYLDKFKANLEDPRIQYLKKLLELGGQEAIKACVDLLILLKKEGVE